MTDLGPHPRFPHQMPPDLRRAIADEVDVTLAGFPSPRSLEAAITAYAEQLDRFLPVDVREGFRIARGNATRYAPTPSEVRACVGVACRARQDNERPHHEREYPGPLKEIPDWRSQFRGMLPEAKP